MESAVTNTISTNVTINTSSITDVSAASHFNGLENNRDNENDEVLEKIFNSNVDDLLYFATNNNFDYI
ncbi:hypothetical protein KPH14_013140, partial [Odynerus spinipes]